jgi:uncharacterized protein YbjT (DUF2867 family)
MTNIVIAGATGLVGRELVRQLEERRDVDFTALVRRTGTFRAVSGRVKEVVFDYRDPADLERLGGAIPCDLMFCALGTTLKRAGSPEAFREVDLDYPAALIQRLASLDPRPAFALVSSLGADKPRGLYLGTKAEVEQVLVQSGLPYLILRPSLLLGQREEVRLGERLAATLLAQPFLLAAKLLAPRSPLLWSIAPIEASQVARTMIWCCLDRPMAKGGQILSGLPLHHPILAE